MKYGGTENESKTTNGFKSRVKSTVLAIGISLGIATSGVTEAQAQSFHTQMALQPAEAGFIQDKICIDPAVNIFSKIPKSVCNVTDEKIFRAA